jgi:hypothetical protein|tara:strand:- start:13 stop:372 length:360 start_codon:yes stop_codon:yes gene_type:complete
MNSTTYIQNKNLWEISLGIDDNYVGDSNLDRLRVGTKLVGKPISDAERALQMSPFAYANFSRSKGDFKGYSTGVELLKPINDRLGVSLKLEVNHNDVIENIVKGEPNNFNCTLGLEIKL